MRRKKSIGRKKTSTFSVLFWIVVTLVSGGGLGGYLHPGLPVVGPLIHGWLESEQLDPRELAKDVLERASGETGTAPSTVDQYDTILPPGLAGSAPTSGSASTATAGYARPRASLAGARQSLPSDTLLIATFNIQVFGTSKMSKPGVVEILAQIIRQFDVVAIQEIRSKDDNILPDFMRAVNADGSRYDFVIGPRLGRSVSTEQYAFVFDTTRIVYEPSSIGTMSDPYDVLHREPFAARFAVRVQPGAQPFSFWLVNIHTDPDEVPEEISALADAFLIMQAANPGEDDVILLGDLNANERQFGRLGQIPGMRWVVTGGVTTNTRKNHAYDNILFDARRTTEFTGRWGVVDIEQAFRISREEALKVSDHLPVWAEFQSLEAAPGGMAFGPPNRR